MIGNSRTIYEKSLGCNFPAYPKTVPNLIVRLEKDAQAFPPDKYYALKDALHWTPNLGAPNFSTPTFMEAFNTFVIPRMFARAIKGEAAPMDAAHAAEAEIKQIAEKWKDV
jgi:multiple sugar transport system substrate-binding protein